MFKRGAHSGCNYIMYLLGLESGWVSIIFSIRAAISLCMGIYMGMGCL